MKKLLEIIAEYNPFHKRARIPSRKSKEKSQELMLQLLL